MRIYDFLEDGRTAAVSMEHVDGPSLAKLALEKPARVFDVADLAEWVPQLCAALDYAHGQARVVHRDLKPANLMVNSRGQLKVADFGISATVSETVTRVSRVVSGSGTPVYMSPQQMRGVSPPPADDIYSLGATLYDLLTGKPPFFRGDNRGYVGTGGNIMIPGFVVSSEGPRTFLVRAAGPALAAWGLGGLLEDPRITVYRRVAGDPPSEEAILWNDNWGENGDEAETAQVAGQVGAFALPAGSKDAAFVITLQPGVYSVHASGADGGTGVALVELYLVP